MSILHFRMTSVYRRNVARQNGCEPYAHMPRGYEGMNLDAAVVQGKEAIIVSWWNARCPDNSRLHDIAPDVLSPCNQPCTRLSDPQHASHNMLSCACPAKPSINGDVTAKRPHVGEAFPK
jgi:hypothetical protein